LIIEATSIDGLRLVKPEKRHDERGYFSRLWCDQEFLAAGVPFAPRQISASYNAAESTLRGMHWQAEPHAEAKLVRATRGAIFDVAVDLRPKSATRLKWFGAILDEENQLGLFIPAGFAHGFITLAQASEVLYLIDTSFQPNASRGARYDDPAFGIEWPRAPAVISGRDLSFLPVATGLGAGVVP
jgi:dTDP-4-dehydrorhamnose 3,5-epimerase